jgi:hypothetical protein
VFRGAIHAYGIFRQPRLKPPATKVIVPESEFEFRVERFCVTVMPRQWVNSSCSGNDMLIGKVLLALCNPFWAEYVGIILGVTLGDTNTGSQISRFTRAQCSCGSSHIEIQIHTQIQVTTVNNDRRGPWHSGFAMPLISATEGLHQVPSGPPIPDPQASFCVSASNLRVAPM